MKKTFISLLSSALISLSLIGGSAFANEEATSTLTVTETPVIPQTQEVIIPETPIIEQSTEQSVEQTQETEQTPSGDKNTSTTDESSQSEESLIDSHEESTQDDTNDAQESDENTSDDTSSTDELPTDEFIEITESEAQALSTTTDSEFEVAMMKGKRIKKKHHHNHTCNHTPATGAAATGSLDLWIRKGASINSTTTGNVGDTVNYVITYGNGGSITATSVVLTDIFPADFVTTNGLVGWTLSGSTYVLSLGTLAPGASGQIVFTGLAYTGLVSGSTVINTASISSDTFEDAILLGNNTASATVTVFGTGAAVVPATGGIVDAYVKKTASITTGNVGDTFTYTLTYGNSGNALATGITLYEQFPASVSGDLSAWTNVGGNVWKIDLPDMAPGFVGSVSITGILIQGATFGANILNLAQITTASSEVTTANNTSFVEIQSFSGSNNCNCNGKNALKGTVYVDTLRNNVYNAGSDGTLPAITVNLYVNGILTHTTMTDGNGGYSFGSLVDGTYQVQYIVPTTYTPVVSNVGDKGGVSTNNMTLSSIVLSGGVTSLENNFGLIREGNGGYAGGGGGGYSIPVPPTPVLPKDPIIPVGPSEEIPLPPELLESGPDLVGSLQEVIPTLPQATAAIKTAVEQEATEVVITFVQRMPQAFSFVQRAIPQRPLLYVDILGGFNQYMYTILMNLIAVLAATGIVSMSLYVLHTTKKQS